MISILCSNYNSSEWISNYCNYLNSQLLYSFEVIFVDALSTDDSLQKIKDFTFREGIEVKIIELSSRETVYAAWNIAIEASKHDYVMNYNTDDKLFRGALLTLQAYISQNSAVDVFYSNCFLSNNKEHTLDNFHNWMDASKKENLLEGCCVGPFPLLKKKTVIDCGMFNPDFWITGDYEMWCRMQSKGAKFYKVDDTMGVYFKNPVGVSTTPNIDRHIEHVRQDNLIREMYA